MGSREVKKKKVKEGNEERVRKCVKKGVKQRQKRRGKQGSTKEKEWNVGKKGMRNG